MLVSQDWLRSEPQERQTPRGSVACFVAGGGDLLGRVFISREADFSQIKCLHILELPGGEQEALRPGHVLPAVGGLSLFWEAQLAPASAAAGKAGGQTLRRASRA